jgi:hypothetical protein
MDNIFFTQEALVWAEESDQDITVFLLDFAKVFNSLSWTFLETILLAKGFSHEWV